MSSEQPRRITLTGADSPEVDSLVSRLAGEDVLGQLLRRDGRMAGLGTEGDDVKLDWVDGVEKALSAPEQLTAASAEGEDIVKRGIRRIIWSGMGGSVQTVYVLKRMGYLDQPNLTVHPLDSTDPASLNRTLQEIGWLASHVPQNAQMVRRQSDTGAANGQNLGDVLRETMMIGVSMGMTSEEPITHLAWFDSLLKEHAVPDPGSHIQVMTLPDSYLDQFARPRGSRMVPIQLDAENHTPGRMSAPATRVFLRPIALLMASLGVKDGLRTVLERGQSLYELSHTLSGAGRRDLAQRDAFLRLAAWLSVQADRAIGAPKLIVVMPRKPGGDRGDSGTGGSTKDWEGFVPWLEQLVEESLGKEGKGFLIFYGQSPDARYGEDCAVLRVHIDHFPEPASGPAGLPVLDLHVPATSGAPLPKECAGLGGLTALFLGFKKTVAAYGYLQDIVYSGQPAVESYKKYARDLREAAGPVDLNNGAAGDTAGKWRIERDGVTLDYSSLVKLGFLEDRPYEDLADALSAALVSARGESLRYLDFTWNGELTPEVRAVLDRAKERLANACLSIPAKVRTGPSDYHSTEQGETDGPPELVSLRLVANRHDPVSAGQYDDKFLLAQARGTWQSMEDAKRRILFMTLPDTSQRSLETLVALLDQTASRLE